MDLQINCGVEHIWSDVLHYFWLAEKTNDKWDFSTYSRTILIQGCIVIEQKLAEYSGCNDVGYSIKKNIDVYNKNNQQNKIDWSSGWAKEYSEILAKRKQIIHVVGNNVRKHFKRNIHRKFLNSIIVVLNGIHSHYNSNESKFWKQTQYEDYKLTDSRCFLSSIDHSCPSEKRNDIGYYYEGKKIFYATLPKSKTKGNYEEMKNLIRGPVTTTFIEEDGEEILNEKWFSRGC